MIFYHEGAKGHEEILDADLFRIAYIVFRRLKWRRNLRVAGFEFAGKMGW